MQYQIDWKTGKESLKLTAQEGRRLTEAHTILAGLAKVTQDEGAQGVHDALTLVIDKYAGRNGE